MNLCGAGVLCDWYFPPLYYLPPFHLNDGEENTAERWMLESTGVFHNLKGFKNLELISKVSSSLHKCLVLAAVLNGIY